MSAAFWPELRFQYIQRSEFLLTHNLRRRFVNYLESRTSGVLGHLPKGWVENTRVQWYKICLFLTGQKLAKRGDLSLLGLALSLERGLQDIDVELHRVCYFYKYIAFLRRHVSMLRKIVMLS